MTNWSELEGAVIDGTTLEQVHGGRSSSGWLSQLRALRDHTQQGSAAVYDFSNNGQQFVFISGQNNQNSNSVGNQASDSNF